MPSPPRRRASPSRFTRTASPTTCTPILAVRRGHGASMCCPFSCRQPNGRPWPKDSGSARGCSNALMADLYGPQRLLHDGSLPAALVLGHPGFLRPCHGIVPPGGCFLHQVAFDLARGPDGRWRIVETRCQAPSGAGYALENRITISRLFPDAFREMHVHMLASFFRTLQETLLAYSPSAADAPHIVLLTPGPYNETYFEHAYLARYLGFTLAEGSDLTVRDDRVYLKTVNGLERVHGDPPPARRRLLRPCGAASGFGTGHSGSRAGVARRWCARRQCPGRRHPRVVGVARLSAGRVRTAPRRDIEAGVHRNVVVWRVGGARRRSAASTHVGHQVRVSAFCVSTTLCR